MTIQQVFDEIEKVVTEAGTVDWLIVRKIADHWEAVAPQRFMLTQKGERLSEPFRFTQGYLIIQDEEFERVLGFLEGILRRYRDDLVKAGNIFVLAWQISCNKAEREDLSDMLKRIMGVERLPALYGVLIKSLNDHFFVHTSIDTQVVDDAKKYGELFQSAESAGKAHEIVVAVLSLVSEELQEGIDFRYIRQMKPLIRAALCAFWGMGVMMEVDEAEKLALDDQEAPFLAAYLVDRSRGRFSMPVWMTTELVQSLFFNWQRTGSYLLWEVLGRENGPAAPMENERLLELLVRSVVADGLRQDALATSNWIESMHFPKDFIGAFDCIWSGGLAYGDISVANKKGLLSIFLRDLKITLDNIRLYVSDDQHRGGPASWRLNETKFQRMLTVSLVLYLDMSDEKVRKDLKNICFETKGLFYGAYKPAYLGRKITEMLLLMSLSADRFTGDGDRMVDNLALLQNDLAETILVPYIHTVEREEQIWNPRTEGVPGLMRSDNLLVNDALARIKGSKVFEWYRILYSAIDETAVAIWPYKDGRKVPATLTGWGLGVNIGLGEQ